MSADVWTEEAWAYMGQRLGKGDKLFHLFREPIGRDLWYDAKPEYATVGRFYAVDVQRHDDTITARIKSATLLSDDPHADAAEWTLAHRAAQVEKDAIAARKRMQKDQTEQIGDLTLNQVRDLVRNNTVMGRSATIAVVLRYLGG